MAANPWSIDTTPSPVQLQCLVLRTRQALLYCTCPRQPVQPGCTAVVPSSLQHRHYISKIFNKMCFISATNLHSLPLRWHHDRHHQLYLMPLSANTGQHLFCVLWNHVKRNTGITKGTLSATLQLFSCECPSIRQLQYFFSFFAALQKIAYRQGSSGLQRKSPTEIIIFSLFQTRL